MAEFTYLFQSFIQKGTLSGSRSTVLQPFYWIIGILTTGIFAALQASAPDWVLQVIVLGLGLSIIAFLGAYFYCLVKDRDALRSERYNVTKMAIESGLKGDDLTGLMESDDNPQEIKAIESEAKSKNNEK